MDEEGNCQLYYPREIHSRHRGRNGPLRGREERVIAMEHVSKHGEPKIVKKCTLPLTAAREVDLIVTDMAFIRVTPRRPGTGRDSREHYVGGST